MDYFSQFQGLSQICVHVFINLTFRDLVRLSFVNKRFKELVRGCNFIWNMLLKNLNRELISIYDNIPVDLKLDKNLYGYHHFIKYYNTIMDNMPYLIDDKPWPLGSLLNCTILFDIITLKDKNYSKFKEISKKIRKFDTALLNLCVLKSCFNCKGVDRMRINILQIDKLLVYVVERNKYIAVLYSDHKSININSYQHIIDIVDVISKNHPNNGAIVEIIAALEPLF